MHFENDFQRNSRVRGLAVLFVGMRDDPVRHPAPGIPGGIRVDTGGVRVYVGCESHHCLQPD